MLFGYVSVWWVLTLSCASNGIVGFGGDGGLGGSATTTAGGSSITWAFGSLGWNVFKKCKNWKIQ